MSLIKLKSADILGEKWAFHNQGLGSWLLWEKNFFIDFPVAVLEYIKDNPC